MVLLIVSCCLQLISFLFIYFLSFFILFYTFFIYIYIYIFRMDQWNASLMNKSVHSFIQCKFNLIVFYSKLFLSFFILFIYIFFLIYSKLNFSESWFPQKYESVKTYNKTLLSRRYFFFKTLSNRNYSKQCVYSCSVSNALILVFWSHCVRNR